MFGIGGSFFDLPLPPPKGEWGSYNFYWLYVKFIFVVQKYIIFFNYQIAVNH